MGTNGGLKDRTEANKGNEGDCLTAENAKNAEVKGLKDNGNEVQAAKKRRFLQPDSAFSASSCKNPVPIPKGLCPPAQGCEARATLGKTSTPHISTPMGLRHSPPRSPRNATPLGLILTRQHGSQGSSLNRNPGLRCAIPLGLLESQPW